RLVLDDDAARDAAPDHDPGAAPRRLPDQRVVLALERRIRDLKDVEDAHLDMRLELRERARHADEAHLPFASKSLELGDRIVLLEHGSRRAQVELHDVEIVRSKPLEALLDGGADILAAEVERLAPGGRHVGRLERATAFAREIELTPPVPDMPAVPLPGVAIK